ncbi:unnamed protein product, partial [Porites lobata]
MNLVLCLHRKWGHRLNCKSLCLSWSVFLFMRRLKGTPSRNMKGLISFLIYHLNQRWNCN